MDTHDFLIERGYTQYTSNRDSKVLYQKRLPKCKHYISIVKWGSIACGKPVYDVEIYFIGMFDNSTKVQVYGLNGDNWPAIRDWGILDWANEKLDEGKFSHFGFSFHDDYDVFKDIIDSYDNRLWLENPIIVSQSLHRYAMCRTTVPLN